MSIKYFPSIKIRPLYYILLVLLYAKSFLPQSSVDSLEIYDPFTQTEEVRRIIKNEFTILRKEYSRSVQLHEFTLRKYKGLNNDSAGYAYISLGDIYFRTSFYKMALENYFEALRIFEAAKDSGNLAVINLKLGRTYYFADMNERFAHYSKAARIFKALKTERATAMYYYVASFLDSVPSRKKQYMEKALEIQRRLVSENPGDKKMLEALAILLNSAGKYEDAIRVAGLINDKWLQVLYLNNYGFTKVREGKYRDALEIFEQSLALSKEGRYKTLLRNVYENIARAYRLSGDLVKSNRYLQLMNLVSESLYAEQLTTQVSEMEVKYESAKKELENINLRQEKKVYSENIAIQTNISILLFVSVSAVSVILLIVFLGNRKLRKINYELDKRNAEISAQQQELHRLYRELLESEKNLRDAQTIAQLANWEFDYKTKALRFSDQFPVIFGLPEETLFTNGFELISKTICFKTDTARLNSFLGLNNSPDEAGVAEFRIVTDSGGKWFKISKSVKRDETGVIDKIYGTVQDITELKTEEENKVKIAEQKSYTNELIKYQEEESKRLAGELHDGLGQDLLLIKNRALLALQNKNIDGSSKNQLEEISSSVSGILDAVRTLTFNLRPLHIERLGLAAVVKSAIEKLSSVSPIRFTCNIDNIEGVLSFDDEITIYRIIQEALNNIIKHSGADQAGINLHYDNKLITLNISDNGKGFDLDKTLHSSGGFGLRNIISRVEMLTGAINITSEINKGTIINISIPVNKNEK